MENTKYINNKLNEALEHVKSIVGNKNYYNFNDVYKVLNSFSYTKEIYKDEVNSYLPHYFPYVDDISILTENNISEEDIYRLYAVNYNSEFAIIIISSIDGDIISNYYGTMINDFTLNIYYALDIMCKDNPYIKN